MSAVQVAQVTTRQQRRHFLDLPATLYRDIPQWIPRIRRSESELVGFRHHAFRDAADCVAFLAAQNGKPCGRIVAIDNRAHRARHSGDNFGFVGFYESVDDREVSKALFDAAAIWLRDRSLTGIRGPVSPSMNFEAGLLISGFEHPPTFMMPYNPPYYEEHWTDYGFEKAQDLFAFRADKRMLADLNAKMRHISAAAVDRFNASVRPINPKSFVQDVATFLELYNTASAGTWGFVPLLDGEIKQLSNELKHLIIPELTTFLVIEDRIVGAAFGILDYNPIVRKIRGRLFPFGFLSLWLKRNSLKKTRIMSINVAPEFQKWGLGLSMMAELARKGIAWGVEEVEFSYVLESNHLAKSTLMHGGAICDKTYRVYDLAFDT